MSQSSPSALNLFKLSTRSLRGVTTGRADLAQGGAGFAGALAQQSSRAGTTDARTEKPIVRETSCACTDEKTLSAKKPKDRTEEDSEGDETSLPQSTQDLLAAQGASDPLAAHPTIQHNSAAPGDPATPQNLADISQRLASQSVAQQATTGPVTAKVLSELALQGQSVGRFALVAPALKPGAASSQQPSSDAKTTPTIAPAERISTTDQPVAQPTALTPTTNAVNQGPLTAPASGDSVKTPASTPGVAAVAQTSGAPAKVEATPDANQRTPTRTDPATQAVSSGAGSPQNGSDSKQDQPGRNADALRGLDAMLGRTTGKSRLSNAQADAKPSPNITAQIDRGVSAALNGRDGVVTLRLSPEQLGPLKIRVSIDNGSVRASFEASNPQAKRAVERSLDGLRESLADRGLKVDQLLVTLAPELPQRDLGLAGVAPDPGSSSPTGSGQSGEHGRGGERDQPGARSQNNNATAFNDEQPITLDTGDAPGFRYVTTPEGRLGVVALA